MRLERLIAGSTVIERVEIAVFPLVAGALAFTHFKTLRDP